MASLQRSLWPACAADRGYQFAPPLIEPSPCDGGTLSVDGVEQYVAPCGLRHECARLERGCLAWRHYTSATPSEWRPEQRGVDWQHMDARLLRQGTRTDLEDAPQPRAYVKRGRPRKPCTRRVSKLFAEADA